MQYYGTFLLFLKLVHQSPCLCHVLVYCVLSTSTDSRNFPIFSPSTLYLGNLIIIVRNCTRRTGSFSLAQFPMLLLCMLFTVFDFHAIFGRSSIKYLCIAFHQAINHPAGSWNEGEPSTLYMFAVIQVQYSANSFIQVLKEHITKAWQK